MSDCNVCLYGSDERCDVSTSANVKARKVYECEECRQAIAKGDLYQVVTQLYEGSWDRFRTCLICAEIRKAFYCDGEVIGEFWSQMQDNAFEEMTTACLNRLTTPAAKAYLLKRWSDWKFNQ